MDFAIAGSPGWSESGGPWVQPEQGMKKIVWSETRIKGGSHFTGSLPQPPSTVGPFQNLHADWTIPGLGGPPAKPIHDLYRDIAVIAYRLPKGDLTLPEMHPTVLTSAGPIAGDPLWDGDFTTVVRLPFAKKGEAAWIELIFEHPQTIQSMSLSLQREYASIDPAVVANELQSSQDGLDFHTISTGYGTTDVERTVTFPAVTARYFRLVLPTPAAYTVAPSLVRFVGRPQGEHRIAEFVLHTTPRIDHFEQKAGFFVSNGLDVPPMRRTAPDDAINQNDLFELTSRMTSDGRLDWWAPPGQWAILRVGYSLIGITNHPASPEATGLEVDKLSHVDVKAYMDNYLRLYESVLGASLIGKRGLHAMVNDSWEAGGQNWTDLLPEDFLRRRGYRLLPWLPALTGRIIGSTETTERFLWDFRRTLGELLTENHYRQIAAILHKYGMIHYGESHESGRHFIGDGMDVKRDDDIPMSAMWAGGEAGSQSGSDADIRESASVAHIYGQNLVAAESMTALGTEGVAFSFAPEQLKPTVDRELADGVNRFVIHTSVHQPLTRRGPGVTLGPFGQWFTRNETWAEQARPWIEYMARSAYLLQQGHYVADIIYYYGQDSNITALYANRLPPVPQGYAYDFANADALSRLSVIDGDLTTTSGMSYRILALAPRASLMSLDVLRQIARLVAKGATVVGNKPVATPSLTDSMSDFHALADDLWGTQPAEQHRYSKGRIISGKSLAAAIDYLHLDPDFSVSKGTDKSAISFLHRQLPDGDLYFVDNREPHDEHIEARFRVGGKVPELWHADTGVTTAVSYEQDRNHTVVPLPLGPNEAVFVVFRKSTRQSRSDIAQPRRVVLASVSGPWQVRFPKSRGAPEHVVFAELSLWNTSKDPIIRYFSGTAIYDTVIDAHWKTNAARPRTEVDLGVVKSVAEVFVNGRSAGIAWKAPFRVDVTSLLRPGCNGLSIHVTNLWPNRLIGDQQQHTSSGIFATFSPYSRDSTLLDSGLLGPVTLVRVNSGPERPQPGKFTEAAMRGRCSRSGVRNQAGHDDSDRDTTVRP